MPVDCGLVAQLVGFAVTVPALGATARQPVEETLGIVVAAAVGSLRHRLPAKLAAPDDQRLVQQPAPLQVRQERMNRPIDLGSVDLQVLLDAVVGVPVLLVVSAAGVDLHETDAALDQPPRDQTLPAEMRRA